MREIPDPGLWIGADPLCPHERHDPGMAEEKLTERERAAAVLLAYGHTNDDVARRLNVSLRTAEGERSRLMRKLGFERRSQLVRWALERGLLH
jgi:DNA-binding NarL/FixJ family response regulator